MGYNKRTQMRRATATACVPVLKANFVHEVRVVGRREKRVSWEEDELIIRVYSSVLQSSVVENTRLGWKFLRL